LGIDPGYGRCGWGVLDVVGNRLLQQAHGVVETPKGETLPRRLAILYAELQRIIRCYEPDEIAMEQLFFSKNVKTAIDVGQARGVAVLACAQAEVALAEYKPNEIKLAVSGYGAATKTQVEHMVRILLTLKDAPKLDDATDALAVAICHAHSRNLKKLADCR